MNVVLCIVSVLGCIALLILGTYIAAFYHSFESNKPLMDKYVCATVFIIFLVFYILMRVVIPKC